MSQSRPLLSLLALTGFVAMTGFSHSAMAQSSCSANSDCEAGYECIKGISVPGCDPTAPDGCPPSEPVESEFGTCEKAPVECQADADCGEYLTCQVSNDGVCWTGPEGSGCTEPDPDAPKYCGFEVKTCSTDSDCPREFTCEEIATDCGCTFKGDCSACETGATHQCQPRQIECETDSECPSDWVCQQFTTGGSDCAVTEPAPAPTEPADGGGTDGSAPAPTPGGTTTDGSEPVPVEEDGSEPVTDCTPTPPVTSGLCVPAELGEIGFASDSGTNSETSGDSGAAPPGAPQDPIDKDAGKPKGKVGDDGGCSVAPALGASSGSWLSALVLLAPLAARIRRRRAS